MNNPQNKNSAEAIVPATPAGADGKEDLQQPAGNPFFAMPPAEALKQFTQDPVGFVQRILSSTTAQHLAVLKEEAELRGALNLFRRAHPEFQRFEPFILSEVVTLLQEDPDGDIDPWDKLLEKALASFSKKFQEKMKEEPMKLEDPQDPPHMEGKANRVTEQPPVFTREQIARMTLGEFLGNEAAINDALKNNRIR